MKRKKIIKSKNKVTSSRKYLWILGIAIVLIAGIFSAANKNSLRSFVLGSSLTPTPTCTPPPSCAYSVPKCLLPEPAGGWCPTATATPTPSITQTNTPYPSPTPTSVPSNQGSSPTPTSSDAVAPTLPSDNNYDQINQGNFSNEGIDNTNISPQAGGVGIQYDYQSDQNQINPPAQTSTRNNQNTLQTYPTEALPSIEYQLISPTPKQKSTNPVVFLFITINNSISNFVKSLFKFH